MDGARYGVTRSMDLWNAVTVDLCYLVLTLVVALGFIGRSYEPHARS